MTGSEFVEKEGDLILAWCVSEIAASMKAGNEQFLSQLDLTRAVRDLFEDLEKADSYEGMKLELLRFSNFVRFVKKKDLH